MNLSISCTRLAGRVAHFLPNWEVLTKDQWVLQTVGGYQLDLIRSPYQPQVPNQIKTSQENSTLVTLEVMELLSKGAIVETQLTPDSFVSQIFLVEKKGGGQRPVINLKALKGSSTSYQLPRTPSSLPCDQSIREGLERQSSTAPSGQYNGGLTYQSQGRYNLSPAVQTSHHNVDLVHFSEHHIDSGTPPWSPQRDSRPGISGGQGSLRLDAQPSCVSENSGEHGSAGGGSVCLSPDKAITTLLQLEGGPGGSSHRCIHAGLVSPERLCEPTLVPDQPLSLQGESRGSASSVSNTTVDYTTLVSHSTGTVGGLPSPAGQQTGSGSTTNGSGVSHETGSSPTDRLAYLRQSYSSQGLSSEASDLMLASWRDKTNSNYGSSFAKWAGWCQRRGRNPLSGPVADVVNFLAELYSQGYQYQSLNCYRSAISSVHDKVDGNSIGVHPAVTRLIKGAFHSRPPQPRYSSFWDVGTVISYLRNLGSNDNLNLRHLTLKTVMLLALTRPSRSADLAKLDIQWMSYQADGVTFRPAHLAKQSI